MITTINEFRIFFESTGFHDSNNNIIPEKHWEYLTTVKPKYTYRDLVGRSRPLNILITATGIEDMIAKYRYSTPEDLLQFRDQILSALSTPEISSKISSLYNGDPKIITKQLFHTLMYYHHQIYSIKENLINEFRKFLENHHEFKIGDRIMMMGMEPGTKFSESEYYGKIVTIDYEKGIANIQYDDKPEGELIEEEIENLTLESDYISSTRQKSTEFSQGGMHGEQDFQDTIIQIIHDKYSDLLVDGNFEELKKKIQIDFPSLDADSIIQYLTEPGQMESKINENLAYYQELVNADRQRLKNASGGEAELIQQNLNFNLKKLNSLKRANKTKIEKPKNTEPRAKHGANDLGIKRGDIIIFKNTTLEGKIIGIRSGYFFKWERYPMPADYYSTEFGLYSFSYGKTWKLKSDPKPWIIETED